MTVKKQIETINFLDEVLDPRLVKNVDVGLTDWDKAGRERLEGKVRKIYLTHRRNKKLKRVIQNSPSCDLMFRLFGYYSRFCEDILDKQIGLS